MRRWWIASATGALTALWAIVPALGASPRPARPTRSVTVELVGSLTIAWQGDQARGCAADSLCGVSGSLQMLPRGAIGSSPGPPPLELTDSSSVARVTELSATGATESTCADPVPVDFGFVVRQASAGGLRAIVGPGFPQQLPSAGRCAGPTAGDLAALTLPARKLGSHGYDLSGRTTFGAGPFTVTVISTVRALISRGANGFPLAPGVGLGSVSTITVGRGSGRPPRTHTALQESAEFAYRIAGLTGTLSTTFAGLAAPLCAPLGTCGTTGTVGESFSAHGVINFDGSRIVKRRAGSRAALAALRAGRLGLFDSFDAAPIDETTTETLARPDGTACSDSTTTALLPGQSSSLRRHAIKFGLIAGAQAGGFGLGATDAFRTRCPGPSSADILGRSPLATASIPLSALGARRLTITFRSGGSFTGGSYGGERGGSVVLSLVLEHARGGTRRVVFASFPGLPASIPPLP